MEFCGCNKSVVFANSETETCMESCIIHLPTCSTKVDVLETFVSILFSLFQMKSFGYGSKRREKLHVLLLVCNSLQLSTVGFDESGVSANDQVA